MQSVITHLNSLNFYPDNFTADGKIQRFKHGDKPHKKNGWYVCYENIRRGKGVEGQPYYVCSFGDWAKWPIQHKFCSISDLKPGEQRKMNQQIAEMRAKAEAEKLRLQVKTAEKAKIRYERGDDGFAYTEYSERKKIDQLYGAKRYMRADGHVLQIPLRDIEGRIWNVQSIPPKEGDKKLFMPNGKVKGCFHVIGTLNDKDAYLCEGFATGASIHQATRKPVIVAFNGANMTPVAKEFRQKYPKMLITICGDSDKKNTTGQDKAAAAAAITMGPIIFPEFAHDDEESTDFNDLHCKNGLVAVTDQLMRKPPEKTAGFEHLGYDETGHYFFSHITKDVQRITAFTHSTIGRLADRLHWESYAEFVNSKGHLNLSNVQMYLASESMKCGYFNPRRIRGTGVWLDENQIVLNTGKQLFSDTRPTSFSEIDSDHIYIQDDKRIPPLHPYPLTAHEGRKLCETASLMSWVEKESSPKVIMGWLMQARICGALPIRPHVWLNGPKGAGKSTVLSRFVTPLLGGADCFASATGSTTEAGLRQRLKNSSIPVVFDEFEPVNTHAKDRVDRHLELMRNVWDMKTATVIKGTPSGQSLTFNLNFCAIVASIRVRKMQDADKSRFTFLRYEKGQTNWPRLDSALYELTEETGHRLFTRAVLKINEIKASQRTLAKTLSLAIDNRYGDQVGSILGAWWMLENDSPISEPQAEIIAKEFLAKLKYSPKDEIGDDGFDCLHHLLTSVIEVRRQGGQFNNTTTETLMILDAIKMAKTTEGKPYKSALRALGIGIDKASGCYIANQSTWLSKLYDDTPWDGSWTNALRAMDGTSPREKVEGLGTAKGSRATNVCQAVLDRADFESQVRQNHPTTTTTHPDLKVVGTQDF